MNCSGYIRFTAFLLAGIMIVAQGCNNKDNSNPVSPPEEEETLSRPNTPSGPNEGETNQTLSYTTGGASSNLGHSLQYRFDWGDGNYSNWSSSLSASHAWSTTGTKYIQAQAHCAIHTSEVSNWSSSKSVVISEQTETISTPNQPTGPDSGQVNETLSYTTGGASSNLGHSLEYRFDWGDGNYSNWSSSVSASHSWSTTGTKYIQAQARCASHTSKVSSWSNSKTVVISSITHAVSTPNRPSGPTSGFVGEPYTYTTGGANCNQGHSVQYRFVWGLADYSEWSYSPSAEHSFPYAQGYYLQAQARCATDTTITSDWSPILFVQIEGAQGSWAPLGSGFDSWVDALTVYNGNLIAGGNFSSAGGVSANHIASWNGSFWSPLGSGIDGIVKALCVYNGQLIAGGWFSSAGGITVNYIASWDGSSWSSLGSGMGDALNGVFALTVYNGQLIAGGDFMTAGGVSARRVAAWNGYSWSALGSGVASPDRNIAVHSLCVFSSQLIAGGDFTEIGGVSVKSVAAWNGSSWSPVGSLPSWGDEAWCLSPYNGLLIAGGILVSDGWIGSWNGSYWSSLGEVSSNGWPWVLDLTVYNSKLIACGAFTTIEDIAVNYIGGWDGSSWSPFGSGMDGHVYGVTVYNGQLIAGGWFSAAGGVAANYIAAWSE